MKIYKIIKNSNKLIFLINYFILLLMFEFFYQKVIIRGIIETDMWLNSTGYSGVYYKVLEFLITELNITIFEANFFFAILCSFISFGIFKAFKSKYGLISYLIIFNFLTIIFILSPGRTSITYTLVMLITYFYYRKIYIGYIFFSYLLYLIHFESLILLNILYFIFYIYDYVKDKKMLLFFTNLLIILLLTTVYKLFSNEIHLIVNSLIGVGQNNLMVLLICIILSGFILLINISHFYFISILIYMSVLLNMNEMYFYRTIFMVAFIVSIYKNGFKRNLI